MKSIEIIDPFATSEWDDQDFLEHMSREYANQYWLATPKELANWYRANIGQ